MTSSLQHDQTTAAQTEWRSGQEVGNLRWAIGYRTNLLGDYLLKLGDRICGDYPTALTEMYELGYARGNRKAAKA
jgi:hypothetical protein